MCDLTDLGEDICTNLAIPKTSNNRDNHVKINQPVKKIIFEYDNTDIDENLVSTSSQAKEYMNLKSEVEEEEVDINDNFSAIKEKSTFKPLSKYLRQNKFEDFALAVKTGKDAVLSRVPIQLVTFLSNMGNIMYIGETSNITVSDINVEDVCTDLYNNFTLKPDGWDDILNNVRKKSNNGVDGPKPG
ncbi:hypothetical protein HK099_007807 [Clydaea vesicula]|uniref:Uncharacterized protein n=1 Tax=Clydaea vesicula TaxID=447962 RepID=A0AAD5XTE7_9FUNG|nr:hypothetical protein HK099_007807 [Clydaea vesicula]